MTTPTDPQFLAAVAVILEHEGGYVYDPNDPGGETNFGISRHAYPNLDIKTLTVQDAEAIYYRDWWIPQHYGDLNDLSIATKVFDMGVNFGCSRSNQLLCQVLNSFKAHSVLYTPALSEATIAVANQTDSGMLLTGLRRACVAHYQALITANPKLAVFKKGWMARAES